MFLLSTRQFHHPAVKPPTAALPRAHQHTLGTYEASVEECKQRAAAEGWQIVQDVTWDGYEEIPKRIFSGVWHVYSLCALYVRPLLPTYYPQCTVCTLHPPERRARGHGYIITPNTCRKYANMPPIARETLASHAASPQCHTRDRPLYDMCT